MIAGIVVLILLWFGICSVIGVAARATQKWDPTDQAARDQYEAMRRIGRSAGRSL